MHAAQTESEEQLKTCRDIIGIGPEGWVPLDQYDDVRQREQRFKADVLEAAAEEGERGVVLEHWMFGDFEEGEYM